jgi:hypothetical protein
VVFAEVQKRRYFRPRRKRSEFPPVGGAPAHVKLNSLRVQAPENIRSKSEPAFRTRFHATFLIAADTFTQSSVEDGAAIVAPAVAKGVIREVDGTAVSKLSGGDWKTEFSLDNNPIPGYG